jgi:hypothetical protein
MFDRHYLPVRHSPSTTKMMRTLAILSLALVFPILANAFSWYFTDIPEQCQNLGVFASGGQPPYNILMVPVGASVLPNGVEVRSIQQIPFNDSSSLNFLLRYPQGESFVAVVRLQLELFWAFLVLYIFIYVHGVSTVIYDRDQAYFAFVFSILMLCC